MPATIILGGQWGDEGKGKLTDALAAGATMVVRANGGSNAGHTVVTDQGTFKFRLIPSGILNPGCISVLGAGVVLDLETLVEELESLADRGIDTSRMLISDRAHIVLPYHQRLDVLEERRRERDEIGTTLNGNGPAYADKVSRTGLRICDLKRPEHLRRKLAIEVDTKNQQLARVFGDALLDFDSLYHNLVEWSEVIAPLIASTETVVQEALHRGDRILVECAQGAMLDIDYGTYPYVTSSSPTAAGACQGAGVAPSQVDDVVGVYKAYSTRVGGGPMPAELLDDTGERIRQRGKEWGVNTGRPRRTGWFDAVAGRQSSRLNGVSSIALTLVDVLDVFDEVRMCVGYELHGETLHHIPALLEDLEGAEPAWTVMPGWHTDTTGARQFADLPEALVAYIDRVSALLGAPVRYVGVGPSREQLIQRHS